MSLKFAGKSCFMTMKNDAEFDEELTCQFKIDIRNVTNFAPSIRTKYIMFEPEGKLCLMALNTDTTFRGKLTCAFLTFSFTG